jgi:dienelactone hydrolase
MTGSKILGLLLITLCGFAHGASAVGVKVKTAGEGYSGRSTPAEIPAKLTLPEGEKLPAVVIIHGSAGPDSRGPFHTEYLVAHGFAVLELDMWAPRGVRSLDQRPRTTLDTMPDVWGAWLFLSEHPRINKEKIAIMGFSWGGVNAMTTAFGKKPKDAPPSLAQAKFAAHVAFYPVCDIWVKNGIASRVVDPSSPTGAPVQIHNGTRDDYDTTPGVCESLKAAHPQLPLEVFMYEGASHGFDSTQSQPIQFFDPVAKNGKGGQVILVGQDRARQQSKDQVLAFLKKHLQGR